MEVGHTEVLLVSQHFGVWGVLLEWGMDDHQYF